MEDSSELSPLQAFNRVFQRTMLAFWIYMLLLPFISPVMEKLIPALWQCQWYKLTGTPCPFCGMTRAFIRLYEHGEMPSLGITVAFFFLLAEFVRKLAFVCYDYGARRISSAIIISDYALSVAGFACTIGLLVAAWLG